MMGNSVQLVRRLMLTGLLLCFHAATWSAGDTFDDLMGRFDRASGPQRVEAANRLFAFFTEEGFTDSTTFTAATPPDTLLLNVHYYVAEWYLFAGNTQKCIEHALKALDCSRGNGDYTWQTESLNLLAQAYFRQSNWVNALKYAMRVWDIDKTHDDYDRQASTLNTIAAIYLSARQPEEAEKYVQKAIEANAKTDELSRRSIIFGLASEVYHSLGQTDKALDYASRAFKIAQSQGNEAKAAVHLSQMASAYLSKKDTKQARQLLEQAIPVLRKTANDKSLGVCLNQMGEVCKLENRLEEATQYYEQARQIFAKIGDNYNRSHSLHGLFSVLYDLNPRQAMRYLDNYVQLRDSLYKEDTQHLLSNYHAKFQNEELSQENMEVRRDRRNILVASIIIGVILLLAIGFLVYAMLLKSRSNQFLLDLQRSRDTFFTHITHEFRTPITVILGMSQKLQALKAPPSQDEVRTSAAVIEREGTQLLLLINQLLDISRVQSGSVKPNWQHGNIVNHLSMTLENFTEYAHTKGVELLFAPREASVMMDFVPDYIQKIVSNLISNAIKFTPKMGRIRVTTRSEAQHFILTVADTGIGIAAKDLNHIFDPFYQSDDTPANEGSGVGLSIVWQIVDSLNGTVTVKSAKDKGTVFTVSLPILNEAKAAPADHAEPAAALNTGGLAVTDTKKDRAKPALIKGKTREAADGTVPLRILIIEDNRDLAYYIGSLLSDRYELFYANNGQMGLEKATSLMPDLVITDVMMPVMDGWEVCQKLRHSEITNHIPIVIITAKTNETDRIKGLSAGADAYLHKPFSASELNIRVDKLIEQRRMLREKFSKAMAEGKANEVRLTDADKQFLGKVANMVYSLMGREAVDVESVAANLCMSPSQFRRKLTAITGQTPVAYILSLRMNSARRMIDAHPEWTIGQVAEHCGYADNAHFSHAFRKVFGVSPSQYARGAGK